jgi:hypothetical protein
MRQRAISISRFVSGFIGGYYNIVAPELGKSDPTVSVFALMQSGVPADEHSCDMRYDFGHAISAPAGTLRSCASRLECS